MKVVILCGGKGTRLHEETEFRPKPLVQVGGMPILWHIMKIYSHFGYKEFILCLGYKGYMIKEYFLNFEYMSNDFTLDLRSKTDKIGLCNHSSLEDWKITFADTGLNTQTGGRISMIEKYVNADEDFFLTYGDCVSNVNINELYAFHKMKNKTVTMTGVHPPSFFGIVTHENGIVTSFKEKPQDESTVNGGFFVCNRKVFDYLSDDPALIFEEESLCNMVEDKEIALFNHRDFWHQMDTQKHCNALNEMWDKGNAPWKIWG